MQFNSLIAKINHDFNILFYKAYIDEIHELLKVQHPLPEDLQSIENSYGIYLFTIDMSLFSNFNELEELWLGGENPPLYTPKVIKKNYNKCNAIQPGLIPLYLGKTEKLQTRLDNHINGKRDSKTYSLKLKQRKNIDLKQIQLAYYKVGFDNEICPEIKQLYLTTLEQKLRKKLFPLVGKQ